MVRDVLGPRQGAYEILENEPKREYITGVLFPSIDAMAVEPPIQPENEAEVPVDNSSEGEDEQSDTAVGYGPIFSPALNPSARPPSMGISFQVRCEGSKDLMVCATWAIYRRESEGVIAWRRRPKFKTFTFTAGRDFDLWLDFEGKDTTRASADISLNVVNRRLDNGSISISIFMVNRRHQARTGFASTEECVFQPQIRIVLPGGAKLVSGNETKALDEEEKLLEFLYRNRTAPARGHMCSAIWKEIDPELNTTSGRGDTSGSQPGLPFVWLDGQILPEQERLFFMHPDLRTDFVPIYAIPGPDLEWREEYGTKPELSPKTLSECWETEKLKSALLPLINAYDKWISDAERKIERQPASEEGQSRLMGQIIEELRRVSQRIRKGIEFLIRDEDARLAFCFSNRTIHVQSGWPATKDDPNSGRHFPWRPFQLAFFLMTVESIANKDSAERDVCDLLWVPTGAGKTEAYLASIIFMIAYRRRRALKAGITSEGDGISVITRYTLRLLTIQQFRRILKAVTAAEYLRVLGLDSSNCIGWRPFAYPPRDDFIWGTRTFSAGMWVGSGVSPNRLVGNEPYPGAIELLKKPGGGEAEPAQVITCPACNAYLAVTPSGLPPGHHSLYFVCRLINGGFPGQLMGNNAGLDVKGLEEVRLSVRRHSGSAYCTVTVSFNTTHNVLPKEINELWGSVLHEFGRKGLMLELQSATAERMGYFIRYYLDSGNRKKEYDFDIFCPNPDCQLVTKWCACTPSGSIHNSSPENSPVDQKVGKLPHHKDMRYVDIQPQFSLNHPYLSDRIRIPAMTVDDQIYRGLPTILVSTIDKFARLPFEPKTSCLFGNVEYHHPIHGYYRLEAPGDSHPTPSGRGKRKFYRAVTPLDPPDIILQDELHLIEGPLGSLAGVYETVVDRLITESGGMAKYIASTATIRRASIQVSSAFHRKLQLFPPHGMDSDDRFFIVDCEKVASDDEGAGRLYVGISAPGQGALTPLSRIWARLLQSVWERRLTPGSQGAIDNFWTLTGYFNSVRELGGAMALYRQDIPDRINELSAADRRPLSDDKASELSSRTSSADLPAVLDRLGLSYPNTNVVDALFTTAMFGTGVDISRLGLMVVNGQPKTTSAYIQSTGRVGRSRAAIVVTFLRATRPRDLSHYEFFCGYHRQLHRYVEPVTINPFAKGTAEKAIGPLCVALLRNMRNTSIPWSDDASAISMATIRTTAAEICLLPRILEARSRDQPQEIRPPANSISRLTEGKLDEWQQIAKQNEELKYVEYVLQRPPRYPVVLGDPEHDKKLAVVYHNAPQSLRDIEETTGFQT